MPEMSLSDSARTGSVAKNARLKIPKPKNAWMVAKIRSLKQMVANAGVTVLK